MIETVDGLLFSKLVQMQKWLLCNFSSYRKEQKTIHTEMLWKSYQEEKFNSFAPSR